ncbi:hypothetical protein, partial [Pseudoflavonifractor sp. HCP28S3_F10]|uniref:hypothetical protein n=1 Tax=Pseudoflavonifractor sp. HCP28S3_F10 TaxID=3438947 RepID=UPI003F8C608A
KAPLLSVDLMPARVGLISREGGLLSPCRWTCGYEIYNLSENGHRTLAEAVAAVLGPALERQG